MPTSSLEVCSFNRCVFIISLSFIQGKELEKALGKKRDQFVSMVAKELHKDQPWYHGYIERDEAESRLQNDGHEDGKFL